MGMCGKCRCFLPPGFVSDVSDICVFCQKETNKIDYIKDGKKLVATKEDLLKEYDIFLKMVIEKNDILKNALHGDSSGIPEKLILDS